MGALVASLGKLAAKPADGQVALVALVRSRAALEGLR